jgi:SAM-dependent methyltransferase
MHATQALKRAVPAPLHPYLRRTREGAASLRPPAQKLRLLVTGSLSAPDRRLLARASGRIHPGDFMCVGDGDHYFRVGLSAIHCLERALERAGPREVRSILDLPCGYGRVLRFLTRRFPAAQVTACEIDSEAVDFCAREFGARPARSSDDFGSVSLGLRFDLIWCGSDVTHLGEPGIAALLRLFRRHLAPSGLAVLTAHGDRLPELMREHPRAFDLEEGQTATIAADHASSGFAYVDYPGAQERGVSVTSLAWIRERVRDVGLRESHFEARAWGAGAPRDGYQDVYALTLEEGD